MGEKIAPRQFLQQVTGLYKLRGKLRQTFLLIGACLLLTSTLGYSFYHQPRLGIGKLARETIVAPSAATIVDPQETIERRQLARQQAATTLKTDPEVTDRIYQNLQTQLSQITQFRQQVLNKSSSTQETSQATPQIADPALATMSPELLQASAADWQAMQTAVRQASERILTQGIPPGLPSEQLQRSVMLHLQPTTPPSLRPIASQLLISVLQPNLVKDEGQSLLQAEKAAQQVAPVMVTISKSQPIVRSGQRILDREFALLEHFGLSRREVDWAGLIGFGALVSGAIALFWQIERRWYPAGLRDRDYGLIVLLSISTPLLSLLGLPATNLPAIGFLMGTFYGSVLSVTLVALLGGLVMVGMSVSVIQGLSGLAGGLFAAWWAARLRSREELACLGVGVGLAQGLLYLLIGLISGQAGYGLLTQAAIQGSMGLAWPIGAIGLSPYLEHLFDLVTTLRLVELANPNRPLLKRLAAETPGTFQHTLFVANLAEAAARELGCNVELVRAGTLYHDIGKMHDPLSFIENQLEGCNRHDQIADPWISASVIKKHVTEGLVMAKKARLPKAVQAFIPEHQGTMAIAYFYHQAQEQARQDATITVDPADFHYIGPIPQSRETGLVMIADACEAALRSLPRTTPEAALQMINKILAARWREGQLADSGLTRENLTTIAQVFVQVWKQFHHQRIAYPMLPSPIPSKLSQGFPGNPDSESSLTSQV